MKSTLQCLLMAIGLSISPFAWAKPDYLVDADWLAEHIDDDNLVVLEVRYHPHRYHTDGQSQTWRSDEILAGMYKSVPKDKTVYAYCDDGFRMSLVNQQLTHQGYQDVRLYNGGWSQWGHWLDLPTFTGDKPFAGDFEL
jgi:3-mercaptopyruvate sulfurtransferase SseA